MGHGGGRVYHSLWPQGVENSSSLAEGGGGTKHAQVSADDREKLLPCHKQLLEQSLNILIQYEINKGVSKAVFSVR